MEVRTFQVKPSYFHHSACWWPSTFSCLAISRYSDEYFIMGRHMFAQVCEPNSHLSGRVEESSVGPWCYYVTITLIISFIGQSLPWIHLYKEPIASTVRFWKMLLSSEFILMKMVVKLCNILVVYKCKVFGCRIKNWLSVIHYPKDCHCIVEMFERCLDRAASSYLEEKISWSLSERECQATVEISPWKIFKLSTICAILICVKCKV